MASEVVSAVSVAGGVSESYGVSVTGGASGSYGDGSEVFEGVRDRKYIKVKQRYEKGVCGSYSDGSEVFRGVRDRRYVEVKQWCGKENFFREVEVKEDRSVAALTHDCARLYENTECAKDLNVDKVVDCIMKKLNPSGTATLPLNFGKGSIQNYVRKHPLVHPRDKWESLKKEQINAVKDEIVTKAFRFFRVLEAEVALEHSLAGRKKEDLDEIFPAVQENEIQILLAIIEELAAQLKAKDVACQRTTSECSAAVEAKDAACQRMIVECLVANEAKDAECLAAIEAKDAECLGAIEAKDAECLAAVEAKDAECVGAIEAKDAECLAAVEAKDAACQRTTAECLAAVEAKDAACQRTIAEFFSAMEAKDAECLAAVDAKDAACLRTTAEYLAAMEAKNAALKEKDACIAFLTKEKEALYKGDNLAYLTSCNSSFQGPSGDNLAYLTSCNSSFQSPSEEDYNWTDGLYQE